MRRKLICFAAVLLSMASFAIETPHRQILVFRNTGEVNLLYADSLEAITMTHNDSGDLCLVFTTYSGNALSVPVAQIDSVAFGDRNEIEIKSNVKVLDDNVDIPYISEYDGKSIRYKSNSPSSILPEQGDLLFYPQTTELFPIGVCAKVISTDFSGDTHVVCIETVSPKEIFTKYFFAGDAVESEAAILRSRAPVKDKYFNGSASATISGLSAKLGIDIELKNMVLNPFQDYYHIDCSVLRSAEFELSLETDSHVDKLFKFGEKTIRGPIVGLIFQPTLNISFFLELEAALSFHGKLTREIAMEFNYTRDHGKVMISQPVTHEGENNSDELSMEALLQGSIYFGGQVTPRFGFIGETLGAGIRLQAGPKIEGELGIGVIQNLAQEFSPEAYSKAQLNTSLCIKASPILHFFNLEEKKVEEYDSPEGFKLESELFKNTINLFPKFEHTHALKPVKEKIVAKAQVAEPVACPLEIGMAVEKITDNSEGSVSSEPIATEFQDELLDSNNDEPVEMCESFDLTNISGASPSETNNLIVRPVFNYKGYTLKAASAEIGDNDRFHGFFTHIVNSGNSIIGGAWDVRAGKTANSTVLIGNYIPRRKMDYSPGISFAGSEIRGKWVGVIQNKKVELVFNEDYTGTWNGDRFSYSLNIPKTGDLKMVYTDSTKHPVTYTVVDITSSTLTLKKKGKSKTYIFTKE